MSKLKENEDKMLTIEAGIDKLVALFNVPKLKQVGIINYRQYIDIAKEYVISDVLSNVDICTEIMKRKNTQLVLKDDKVSWDREQLMCLITEYLLQLLNFMPYKIYCSNYQSVIYNGRFYETLGQQQLEKIILGLFDLIYKPASIMLRMNEITKTIFQRLTEYPKMVKNCISFSNCIVQITKSGKIYKTEHTPTIFTTKYFDYNYDEKAKCPMFMSFLDQILDKESQKTLQQAWGYVLMSSDISIEKVFCMSGCGANGKTVCEEIATAVFGGNKNVSNASISMLASDANMRADAYDKMLVYSDEMGRLNGADLDVLKSMASNQNVDCKLMRKDRFVAKWQPRIMFNTNRLPTSENTHGFFRRIVIIPFNNVIPKDKQDIHLANKIIKKELSGIFNWVIEGMNDLIRNSCKIYESESNIGLIKEYKESSNSFLQFLKDFQVFAYGGTPEKVKLVTIRQHYKNYCDKIGIRPQGRTSIITTFKEQGYVINEDSKGTTVVIMHYADNKRPFRDFF